MATGIVKRHSPGCRSRDGGRCNCGAGYEAWVNVRRNGRRVKVRKSFGLGEFEDAKAWRAEALAAKKVGALRPAKRYTRTLAEALAEFIAGMEAGEVRPKRKAAYKPATIRTYEQHVRLYVADDPLGQARVTELTRLDVQDFADRLLGAGLSPGTVANVLNPIQAFFRREVERGRLAVNPASGIDVPEGDSKRAKRIASGSEAAKLIEALPEQDRALWACAFYAGLRRGELQALRVRHVDLGASVIHVERGRDQEEGEIDPKSSSSRRTVPLLAVLRDYLDERVIRRSGDDLVFGRTAADPFSPPVIGVRAKRAWEDAGLEPITLHECRHTFASLLIDSGANAKAIQEYMGHSKIQTTFDTYGHLIEGSRDEVRRRMDAYLDAATEAAVSAE